MKTISGELTVTWPPPLKCLAQIYCCVNFGQFRIWWPADNHGTPRGDELNVMAKKKIDWEISSNLKHGGKTFQDIEHVYPGSWCEGLFCGLCFCHGAEVKMQFRRVDLVSIGPPSQKFWPNFIFGPISPLLSKCKTLDGWQWGIYGSINLEKKIMKPSFAQPKAQVEHWGRNQQFYLLLQPIIQQPRAGLP